MMLCQVGALELKSGFAGCVREGFDFTMIEVTAAVEDHCADVGSLGALGEECSDFLRALDVRGAVFERLVERRGGDQSLAGRVVDDLGVDVLV